MASFTITTDRGATLTWRNGAFGGDPRLVDAANHLADVAGGQFPYTPTGPVARGGLRSRAFAWLVAVAAVSSLRHRVASSTGAPEPPARGDGPPGITY